MKSVYHHHRAGSLWSRGRSSEDPVVIEDCAAQLERYNYHEHAAILRAKLPAAVEHEPVLPPPNEPEQVDVKVVVAPKRARKKKGG